MYWGEAAPWKWQEIQGRVNWGSTLINQSVICYTDNRYNDINNPGNTGDIIQVDFEVTVPRSVTQIKFIPTGDILGDDILDSDDNTIPVTGKVVDLTPTGEFGVKSGTAIIHLNLTANWRQAVRLFYLRFTNLDNRNMFRTQDFRISPATPMDLELVPGMQSDPDPTDFNTPNYWYQDISRAATETLYTPDDAYVIKYWAQDDGPYFFNQEQYQVSFSTMNMRVVSTPAGTDVDYLRVRQYPLERFNINGGDGGQMPIGYPNSGSDDTGYGYPGAFQSVESFTSGPSDIDISPNALIQFRPGYGGRQYRFDTNDPPTMSALTGATATTNNDPWPNPGSQLADRSLKPGTEGDVPPVYADSSDREALYADTKNGWTNLTGQSDVPDDPTTGRRWGEGGVRGPNGAVIPNQFYEAQEGSHGIQGIKYARLFRIFRLS